MEAQDGNAGRKPEQTSVSDPLGGDGVGGGSGSVGGGGDPGKGRGRGGKRQGAKGGGSEGNPDSEHESTVSGSRSRQRICISNFWKQCKSDPASCSFGAHVADIPSGLRNHRFFKMMVEKHGEPPAASGGPTGGAPPPPEKA